MNTNQIEFFNLSHDGDSAVVRILSTNVNKIERRNQHTIVVDGKKKNVACLNGIGKSKCPLCEQGDSVTERLYVHLYDYGDNKEKVWSRTPNPKFLATLQEINDNWGNLSDCVVKITRDGDNFPSYTVSVQPPTKYALTDDVKEMIDKDISYRFVLYRSADEIDSFLKTGVLPPHVKKGGNGTYVPKEQWLKQNREKKEQEALNVARASYEEHHRSAEPMNVSVSDDFDGDPFSDPFLPTMRGNRV